MLLVSALLAVQAPAATRQPMPNDEQIFCVFNALDDETLGDMGELVVDNGRDSLPEIGEAAAVAVDECAKRWKWSTELRAIGALTAAARAAIQTYEGSFKERFSHAQLRAIFDEISEQDKQGLTISGYARLEAGDRYHQSQRLDALFKRHGVRPVEILRMTFLVTAVARFQEMREAWARSSKKR